MPAPYGNNSFAPSYMYPTTTTVPYPQVPSTYQQTYPPSMTTTSIQQPSALVGRFVNAIEEVTAQEVPMNGDVSIFPKRDGSAIYVKSWNSDGTIKTTRYILDENTEPEKDISTRLDDIERRLGKLEYRKKNYNDGYRGNRSTYSNGRSNSNNNEEMEVIDNE